MKLKPIQVLGYFALVLFAASIGWCVSEFMSRRPGAQFSIIHAGGTIRPYVENGHIEWRFIQDGQHAPLYFEKVSVEGDAVVVHFPKVQRIVTFSVVPDESLAALGVTAGASVDVDRARIRVFNRDGTSFSPAQNPQVCVLANLWVLAIFER